MPKKNITNLMVSEKPQIGCDGIIVNLSLLKGNRIIFLEKNND
jgi:hypothetical protein